MNLLFRILNPIMGFILKSPLHGMVSKSIMLVTFTGRKSGRTYSTPVSYFVDDGTVYCFTHAKWWRNLVGGAPVKVHIRGKLYGGQALPVVEDITQIASALEKMFAASPVDANFYGVTLDENGKPDAEQIKKAAAEAVMIRITLN